MSTASAITTLRTNQERRLSNAVASICWLVCSLDMLVGVVVEKISTGKN